MKTTLLLLLAALSAPALAGTRIQVDVPEPSGIDFDRDNGRLFVVDDGGELWVLDENFDEIDVFDLGGDLEGVDYLPVSDQLIVAVEGEESLLVVDPDTGEIRSSHAIPRTFQGRTILAAGGNGIETITVVGRRIFVANQSFDIDDEDDGSMLVELILRPDDTLEVIDAHRLPMLDVAGSLYSAPSGELLLLSDTDNTVYRLRLDILDALPVSAPIPAALLGAFAVPGEDQEGICLMHGDLLIAQDSGDLFNAGPLRTLLRQ
jgi:hypothetical protein